MPSFTLFFIYSIVGRENQVIRYFDFHFLLNFRDIVC